MVTFVFSNPKHHVELMVPVARALARHGAEARFVSLAELRGFPTPELAFSTRRALPVHVRRDPSIGAGVATSEGRPTGVRRVAQRVIWRGALGPRLRWLLRGSDAVVVPNDAAFPYADLALALTRGRTPFALVQEGVRYRIPGERNAAADVYGTGGAGVVCAWGEAAAAHFVASGVPASSIRVTGNPRFDDVDVAVWRARGAALVERLGLACRPLLYLSSPIDDLGFCTTAEKLAMFERFLAAVRPRLAADGRGILVKLHPREDAAGFRAIADAAGPGVVVVGDEPIFSVLGAGDAAVIQMSTVGLEALAFGLPLGVLAIPGHGHVFDYVASGAARGLALDESLADGVVGLLARPRGELEPAAVRFLEHHLAHRGNAAERVAACIADLARGAPEES